SAFRAKDRYEDFITQDLVNDVEQYYRVLGTRETRGIAGVSMGGYGAIKIALRHPQQYGFAASLSGPFDVTGRRFAARRFGQSLRLIRVFGFSGGPGRRDSDVFLLAQKTDTAPYIYLACGRNEGLLEVNRSFDNLLTRRGLAHEYHESPGDHSW